MSLIVCMGVLLAALMGLISQKSLSIGPLVILMMTAWIAVTGLHMALGYFWGSESYYLVSLCGIIMFWLGQKSIVEHKVSLVWTLLLLAGLILSMFSVFQHILFPDQIYNLPKTFHVGRLSGPFLSSNTAATCFGVIVIAAIAQVFRNWRIIFFDAQTLRFDSLIQFIQKSNLSLITFLFSFSALLMTASRAGIIFTLLAMILFCFWIFLISRSRYNRQESRFLGPAWILGIVATMGILWLMSGDMVNRRFSRLFVDYETRGQLLEVSWLAFLKKPLIGHGPGNFNNAEILGTNVSNNAHVIDQNATHNFYLQTLVESGAIGLSLVVLFFLAAIMPMISALRKRRAYSSYMAGALAISFLVCAHGLTDFSLEVPGIIFLHAFILGIGFQIAKNGRSRESLS